MLFSTKHMTIEKIFQRLLSEVTRLESEVSKNWRWENQDKKLRPPAKDNWQKVATFFSEETKDPSMAPEVTCIKILQKDEFLRKVLGALEVTSSKIGGQNGKRVILIQNGELVESRALNFEQEFVLLSSGYQQSNAWTINVYKLEERTIMLPWG